MTSLTFTVQWPVPPSDNCISRLVHKGETTKVLISLYLPAAC